MNRGADSICDWLLGTRVKSQLRVDRIAFRDCAQWLFQNGRLHHRTGRFFSIVGVRVSESGTAKQDRQFAMIDQPEVGWLGFIIRRGSSGFEWLIQAKTEPGNINATQLAPSIQATRSNYNRSHGGRPTAFLDLFRKAETFISDAPHSEQGTRFLWKFNRNSVLILPEEESPALLGLENWMWCSSAQLRELLADDYRVNTDARSVIASAPWALLADDGPLFSAFVLTQSYKQLPKRRALQAYLDRLDPASHARVPRWQSLALDELNGWTMTEQSLTDERGREQVACFDIHVQGREVDRWCQPFLMQAKKGDHVLLMRLTGDGAEFFVRIYQEIGFGTRKEYGPSVHSSHETPAEIQNWLSDGVGTELARIWQSDEGGRFMEADACYRIVLVRDVPRRDRYTFGSWVSLAVLERLVTRPGTTTNELRTLASLILSREFDDACANLLE